MYNVKKKNLFGCFRIEEIRDKDNATGLKEGGGIKMTTTVLSIYVMHALFALNTYIGCNVKFTSI